MATLYVEDFDGAQVITTANASNVVRTGQCSRCRCVHIRQNRHSMCQRCREIVSEPTPIYDDIDNNGVRCPYCDRLVASERIDATHIEYAHACEWTRWRRVGPG